jgi:rubrerythrin
VAKSFKDLSEQEILALAISLEETDARIYADFAAALKADYPGTAQIFKEMEAEEDEHRRKLLEEYRRRFGEHIPLIRSRRREGIRAPQTGVADAAAGNQNGSTPGRDNGDRDPTFLRTRC